MNEIATSPAELGTYRDVVTRLGSAQKASRGAPGYSRWVNRRLGRYLAAWAYLRGLTPNQVTAISAIFTFAGIGLVASLRPSWPLAVGVVALLLLGYAFDSADGQIARLRGGGTPVGEWLDHVTDCVKCSAVHLATLICWFRFYDVSHPSLLLAPVGYTLVSAVFFFGVILSEQMRRCAARAPAQAGSTSTSAPALRSLIVLPADYGVLCLVFLALPAQRAFIALYSLLLAANLVFLIGALRNWYRELRALTSPLRDLE